MPEKEEAIVGILTERFEFLKEKCNIARVRRIFAEAPREVIHEVVRFIRDELLFGSLGTITGLDAGEAYQLIYHLSGPDGIVINLKTYAPKSDPVFESIVDIYHNSTLYEIEIHNMFGVSIKGIPADISYPLPDGWPEGQYPLRKDWTPASTDKTEETGEGC